MHPILFSIGGFDIHVWGLMVSLGAAAGYMTALRFAEGSRFTESILWGYFFYAIPVGLAGARLWEVLFSWQNYAADPLQALMLWQGGMSIQGAVAADLLLAWGYMRKQKLSLAAFGDILAPGLILGQAIGRIGCFLMEMHMESRRMRGTGLFISREHRLLPPGAICLWCRRSFLNQRRIL